MPELLSRMPATYGRYFEPFAGGAALFFALRPQQAVLSDENAELINVYHQVAINADEVIELLEHHRASHCADWYYEVREAWNAHAYATDPEARAAVFLYLNRTCFNGLWRVNRLGAFNVPIGKYADPLAGMADRLRAAAPVLARADLRVGDYRATLRDAVAGDFVYLDPPYDGTFTGYTADSFGAEQQAEVAATARLLAARGVHVIASNADTPLVRELYAGCRIDTVRCGRAINSKASGRGAVNEVIVTIGCESARSAA